MVVHRHLHWFDIWSARCQHYRYGFKPVMVFVRCFYSTLVTGIAVVTVIRACILAVALPDLQYEEVVKSRSGGTQPRSAFVVGSHW